MAGAAFAQGRGMHTSGLQVQPQRRQGGRLYRSHFALLDTHTNTCRSSRNEGKVVSYRFEEERGPPRPPRDGPLVKGGREESA